MKIAFRNAEAPCTEARAPAATRAQLEAAQDNHRTLRHLRLGDALIQENLITMAQRDAALAVQGTERGKRLGEILVEMGAVSRESVRRVLVERLGIPVVDLRRFPIDNDALAALPACLAHQHTMMPLFRSAARITVAIENPMAFEALHELEAFCGLKVEPVMASRQDLLHAIDRHYGPAEVSEPCARPEAANEADDTLARLVHRLVVEACEADTRDIRIEFDFAQRAPVPNEVRVVITLKQDGIARIIQGLDLRRPLHHG